MALPGFTGSSNNGLGRIRLQVSASLETIEARDLLYLRIIDWHQNRMAHVASVTKEEIKATEMKTFGMRDFNHWAKAFAKLHEKQIKPAYEGPVTEHQHYITWCNMTHRLLADLGDIATYA